MASIDTLIEDINKYLESYQEVTPEQAQELASFLSQVIVQKLSKYRPPSLSMSSIGKPARRLKFELEQPIKPSAKARLKFLYGDILEVLLLWLAKQAGHSVEQMQTEVSLKGVSGHNDAVIDGVLVDVKSCSPQSFKKFRMGTLPHNDPFGYLAQLSAYKDCLNTDRAAFFAVDKVSGEMCLYGPDPDFELPDPAFTINRITQSLLQDAKDLPKCYSDIEAGSSGNRKLDTGCKYCPYKRQCWDNLRVFLYAKGPEYFTRVVKEPNKNIKEITYDNEKTEELE